MMKDRKKLIENVNLDIFRIAQAHHIDLKKLPDEELSKWVAQLVRQHYWD